MDDLQTLIKELETEKSELLRLIDEAVKEQEFLIAHFHLEALEQINRRLQTLKNLKDEFYDDKYFIKRVIENLRKKFKEEPDDSLKSITSRFIDEKEKELSELNQIPKRQKSKSGKNVLLDYLSQFVRGEIRGLHITLGKTGNLSIEINRIKVGAKLTMSNIRKLEADYLLSEERILKLKGLGFMSNKKGDKAIISISGKKNELTDKIIKLISVIVFEVFYFKELGSEGTIEILNKRTGQGDKH